MKKILIIGSSGAGKSTLARQLGEIIRIEVIHLDEFYWKPNWTEPSKEEWCSFVAKLIKEDAWIMDGNFSGTIEMRVAACDTVIFLEIPRLVCIYRILKRVIVYRKKNRPDMAEGCAERFDWEFIKWVWNYPNQSKLRIEKTLEDYKSVKTIIRLKSKQAVEIFLSNL